MDSVQMQCWQLEGKRRGDRKKFLGRGVDGGVGRCSLGFSCRHYKAKTLSPRAPTTPTPAPRGTSFAFILFCFTLSFIFTLAWTSRTGSELCCVAGMQGWSGRGSDAHAQGRWCRSPLSPGDPRGAASCQALASHSLSPTAPSAITEPKQEWEGRNSSWFSLPSSERCLAQSPISQSLLWRLLIFIAAWTECRV